MRKILYILGIALLLTGCSEEDSVERLSPMQRDLIGQGVHFEASIADPYATRTTYRHDGSFNEEDIMTIYRQYSHDAGITFDPATAYRVYELKTKYATGTTFALETDWLPKEGETGYDPADGTTPERTFTQTEADSLTWENGKTVRFRSWSRSNLASAISNSASKKYTYYPDYCISEWVTVSGPTIDVPLTLKHQGCRIGFIAKSGNELCKAEICTDWHDYMWPDNSTDKEHDNSASEHGKTEAQARAEADAVIAVYNQMCMPAGVDISTSLLTTMTKNKYDTTTDFSMIHAATDGIVKLADKTPEEIASDVQRPVFCSNDGRLYMVSIPYNMSNDEHKGEGLKLPACTRFRLWIFDVNDGDKANTDNTEAQYHILTLSDVKIRNTNTPRYPEGLELVPGNSYMFSVGYHYDNLTVTPADNFSWEQQDAEAGSGTNEIVSQTPSDTPYKWWKDALVKAVPNNISQIYNPVFHIKTQAEFLEFINLVNGTATTKNSGLTQVLSPDKTYDKDHPAVKSDYRWYPSDYVEDGKIVHDHEADSVTHAVAEAQGYIFYEHYHPANADQAAYSSEDYLRGPYSFFDEDLNRHFTVVLDNDLDFYDWKLTTIGNAAANPFRGVFEGGLHTLKNIYMDGGYMFGYCYDVAIRNLKIETVHNFMLLNTASAKKETGYGAYVVGISIKSPSSGNPVAASLYGSSYVVGCIYEGHAGGAMVGTADNLNMVGNMMAASGLPSGSGALLGSYVNSNDKFFAPQTVLSAKKLTWGRFMVNYYDKELSPGTTAVGGVADNYLPQEYIRGAHSHILKAKNDNLLTDEVPYEKLTTDQMREGYYGLAPWKALNYAIWKYNSYGAQVSEAHNCKAHFVNDNVGYAHTYPRLVPGEPDSDGTGDKGPADDTGYKGKYDDLNIFEQNN